MKKSRYIFLFISLICFLFFGILVSYGPTATTGACFMMVVFNILFYGQLFQLLLRLIQSAREEADMAALQAQAKLQQEQDLVLGTKEEAMIEYRENSLNKMKQLQEYLKSGDYEKADAFLGEISDDFQHARYVPICQNSLINAILTGKKELAAHHQIRVDYPVMMLPEEINIPQSDLSSVFFNLLDNGIESCLNSGAPEPHLSLSASLSAGYIHIEMRNSKDPSVTFSRRTSKINAIDHGFGLSIIEEICKKHDGTYEWKDMGDEFVSTVLLKAGEPSL